MGRLLIAIILTLLTVAHVLATTYYVSNSGNNSNNGLTQGTAFLTLQYAADRVAAGDSVVVLPGSYAGFYQTTSGTPQQPIVFAAQAGVLINTKNYRTNDGINLEGANYIIIEGFKVVGMPRTGIRAVLDTGVVIRNNVCDSNQVWGILTGFSENIVIDHNECSRSVQEHGIYFGNSADYPVIRNNICWGNNACGIHINSDVETQPEEGEADGIISGALVENNIIYNNGTGGGSGINCDGVQNSRIQNNLLYNNHSSGISLYQIDGAEGAMNNVIVNNTILQPIDGRWALNISDGSTGNVVFNNIFLSSHPFRGSISIDDASLPGFKSNYNILTNRMSNNGGDTNMSLVQWLLNTGLDSNSIITTPAVLFIDAVLNDYKLSILSPAKEMGVENLASYAAPTKDIEGEPRPQGNSYDVGAYEYKGLVTWIDRREEAGMNIYPNPVMRLLHVSLNKLEADKLAVYDAGGRLLIEAQHTTLLDVSHFTPGIYYVEARSNSGSFRKRFIKM